MNSSIVTVTLNPAVDKTVTVQELHIGGLNRIVEMRTDPGGKGINVAKVLRNFNVQVKATGFIAGFQGKQLLKKLEEKQIFLDFVNVDGEIRTNLKVLDLKNKIITEFNENGFQVTSQQLAEFKLKLESILVDTSILVLGGSYPQGIPSSIYQECIELAHSKGIKTILDADGIAFQEALKAKPYAVKPNIYELEQWIGHPLKTDQEIIEAGQKLLNSGIQLVLISMGEAGSICLDKNEAYKTIPFAITPRSTVGAGDSMVGTLSYAILNDFSLHEIAAWTTTAGTISASKPGTQVCTFDEVKNSVSKVHVSKIDIYTNQFHNS